MYLFVDTETSGISTATSRSVQIAWVLTDTCGRAVIEKCQIIRPEGFEIEPGAARVHGISQARANFEGLPIRDVLLDLKKSLDLADILIGHNIQFDVSILENDARAAKIGLTLHDFPKFCTMKGSAKWCEIAKLNGKSGFKWPTLSELHRRCLGHDFEGAHDALNDVQATKRCFFKLLELDVIERPRERVKPAPKSSNRKSGRVPACSNEESPPVRSTDAKDLRKTTSDALPRARKPRRRPIVGRPPVSVRDQSFTSTIAVEKSCPRCQEAFRVTLTRYETTCRCPKCYGIVVCEIDWSKD